MLDRGIRVGMGTDGPASNDGLDLFADLRLAASLAGSSGRSATALTAAEAFWLATGAAADAVDRPDLGQLEAGRRADLVHVDTRDLVFEPVGDPATSWRTSSGPARGRHVRDPWSEGGRWWPTAPRPRWTSTSLRRRRRRAGGPARHRRIALQPNG